MTRQSSTALDLNKQIEDSSVPIAPYSQHFSVNYASVLERQFVIASNNRENRQSMNLRLMPDSKLLIVRDLDHDNAISGWAGFDYQYNPKFPEAFSFYTKPEYRSQQFAFLLMHLVSKELIKNKVTKLFMRVELSSNMPWMAALTRSGLVNQVPRETFDESYLSLCKQCNLYGELCPSQSFFEMHIDKFYQSTSKIIGKFEGDLPAKINFELQEASIAWPIKRLGKKDSAAEASVATASYVPRWGK